MTVRQYATPLAFKQALEQRLKSASTTGTDFARRRQLVVFDRFLARLIRVAGDTVILKGGLALKLRLDLGDHNASSSNPTTSIPRFSTRGCGTRDTVIAPSAGWPG